MLTVGFKHTVPLKREWVTFLYQVHLHERPSGQNSLSFDLNLSDNKQCLCNIKALTELYCFLLKGRLPLKSIKAMERSALPGRMEFELTGMYVSEQLYYCKTTLVKRSVLNCI